MHLSRRPSLTEPEKAEIISSSSLISDETTRLQQLVAELLLKNERLRQELAKR